MIDNSYYGIDFGTSNSAISVNIAGNTKVLPINQKGKNPEVLESAIYFDSKSSVFFSGSFNVDCLVFAKFLRGVILSKRNFIWFNL